MLVTQETENLHMELETQNGCNLGEWGRNEKIHLQSIKRQEILLSQTKHSPENFYSFPCLYACSSFKLLYLCSLRTSKSRNKHRSGLQNIILLETTRATSEKFLWENTPSNQASQNPCGRQNSKMPQDCFLQCIHTASPSYSIVCEPMCCWEAMQL